MHANRIERLRLVTGIWLCLALPAWGRAAEVPDPAPPVYQYLILVEASASMVRQKEVALDSVHELILSGFYSRIRPGEVLGIWPFKDQVNQKLMRPVHWSPRESRDLSNFVYRKLRDLEFEQEPELDSALAAVIAEARRSERLTAFLVTSGKNRLAGTPFDAQINGVFEQHGEAMRKAKRPFVVVLVFEAGNAVAQAVTPGGRTIYVPPTPATAAGSETARAPAAEAEAKPETIEPAPQPAPPPQPMTVEEISAKLREAQAQQAAQAAAQAAAAEKAAAVIPESDDDEPGASPIVVAREDPPESAPPESAPAIEVSDVPIPRVADAPDPSAGLVPETARPSVSPPVEPPVVEQEPPALETEVTQPVAVEMPSVEEVEVADAGTDAEAPGLMLPPGQARGDRRVYLAAGVGLLVLAIVILVWRLRRPRRRGRASVISQSMHR